MGTNGKLKQSEFPEINLNELSDKIDSARDPCTRFTVSSAA